MNRTNTDHMLQMEKPMCSVKIEQIRLRRATQAPPSLQKVRSSGRQSAIHRPGLLAVGDFLTSWPAVVVIGHPPGCGRARVSVRA